MSSETIRDEQGRIIAHLQTEGDLVRLRDPKYRTLGYYSRTRDHTMDERHKVIGQGDQLLRLIPRR